MGRMPLSKSKLILVKDIILIYKKISSLLYISLSNILENIVNTDIGL